MASAEETADYANFTREIATVDDLVRIRYYQNLYLPNEVALADSIVYGKLEDVRMLFDADDGTVTFYVQDPLHLGWDVGLNNIVPVVRASQLWYIIRHLDRYKPFDCGHRACWYSGKRESFMGEYSEQHTEQPEACEMYKDGEEHFKSERAIRDSMAMQIRDSKMEDLFLLGKVNDLLDGGLSTDHYQRIWRSLLKDDEELLRSEWENLVAMSRKNGDHEPLKM
ncbi:Hypothetical protein D9617_5g070070 [Elsinoe fawcettii]|nr:Hypothetical protein D9617_5g070070 [Elsinoe fawcettii]